MYLNTDGGYCQSMVPFGFMAEVVKPGVKVGQSSVPTVYRAIDVDIVDIKVSTVLCPLNLEASALFFSVFQRKTVKTKKYIFLLM